MANYQDLKSGVHYGMPGGVAEAMRFTDHVALRSALELGDALWAVTPDGEIHRLRNLDGTMCDEAILEPFDVNALSRHSGAAYHGMTRSNSLPERDRLLRAGVLTPGEADDEGARSFHGFIQHLTPPKGA